MKALVFEEPRRATVSEVDVPAIAPDEVLVRSRNVGICHSDFELFEGRYIIPVSYPIIPGHEWSGEVAEVGSGVTGLRPGDRIVGECVVNNGDDHFGFSISGADAEYFVAKASWLHRIPEELSFSQGAFVEPFSVAYSAAVAAGGIDASDDVAVIGGGPIGLLCTLAAATMGSSVTLIEPQAHRRALGLEIGARHAIDPTAGDPSEQTAEATGGRGFGVVIEAAGAPAAMASAFPIAALGARVVFVGGRRDRPRPVQGAPRARDHRLRRDVAAHHSVHGDERCRSRAAPDRHVPARRRNGRTRGSARHEPQRQGSDRVLSP